MSTTASYTDRLTGGRDGDPKQSLFDFDPADVCPDCHTIRARSGACCC